MNQAAAKHKEEHNTGNRCVHDPGGGVEPFDHGTGRRHRAGIAGIELLREHLMTIIRRRRH